MAALAGDMSYSIICILYGLLLLLCPCHVVWGSSSSDQRFAHTVDVRSLLPSASCNQPKVTRTGASLEVVHQYGPCIKTFGQGKATKKAPSHDEILLQDELRVHSIQAQARLSKNSSKSGLFNNLDTTLPLQSGAALGTGNYLIKVGLGTPKKDLTFVLDTGSSITWTQCEPCVGFCYQQLDPKFDPTKSTTYRNVSCSSASCDAVRGSGGLKGCDTSSCLYQVLYGDNSYSIGFFATEKLTITPTETFSNFLFGCGQQNKGTLGKASGIIGLGRKELSVASQTSSKYNKLFSYCIPSSSSSTGHFTLGGKINPKTTKFTPLSQDFQNSVFYGLDMIGISLGGQKLDIDASVFQSSGTIIDSGTVTTRLPATAYSKLRAAFQEKMKGYTQTSGYSILDTCYDFSGQTKVTIPLVSFAFKGGNEVVIDGSGMMSAVGGLSKVCLVFAGNSDDTDVAIFGNTQQKTYEVVYDGAQGRIGFAPNGCA